MPAETPDPGSSPSSAPDGTVGGGQSGGPPAGLPGGDGTVANAGGGTSGGSTGASDKDTGKESRGGAVESSIGLPGAASRLGPGDLLGSFVTGVAERFGPGVKPAVAIAATFGFPLALMLAVLLFLIIQSRLDDRDPKLRAAPLTSAETYLPFADEGDL